jgi:hypothetical protein
VRAVFTRFVQEAETPLGNQSAVEASVVELQDALTAAMVVRANSARSEALRTCAHELQTGVQLATGFPVEMERHAAAALGPVKLPDEALLFPAPLNKAPLSPRNFSKRHTHARQLIERICSGGGRTRPPTP